MHSIEILNSVQAALEEMNPFRALENLENFQQYVEDFGLSKDEIGHAAARIDHIRLLTSSALAGVSAALTMVREIAELSSGCGTYGRDGRRLDNRVQASEAHRF